MANFKTLRKRDILRLAVIIVAAVLLVFGATALLENASAKNKRKSRPIDPNASTTAPTYPDEHELTLDSAPELPPANDPIQNPGNDGPSLDDDPSLDGPDLGGPSLGGDPAVTNAPDGNGTPSTTTEWGGGLVDIPDEGVPDDVLSDEELFEIKDNKDEYSEFGYNNNIKNIVLIGVDRPELGQYVYYRSGGQSDVIMILSMNMKTKEYWLVSVNRDLAVPVENFSQRGDSYGFVNEQIALAYAYGDGGRSSGNNVLKSLNFLFSDNIPFLGYIAAPIPIVATLADAVDGVPVEITDDFTGVDDTLVQGTTVVLRGQHAENFVRARKAMTNDPYNAARMTRQFTFLNAFIAKARSEMTANQVVELYDDLTSMTKTNMGRADIVKWILTAYDYEFKGLYRIDGKRRTDSFLHNAPFNDIVSSEVQDVLNLYFKR